MYVNINIFPKNPKLVFHKKDKFFSLCFISFLQPQSLGQLRVLPPNESLRLLHRFHLKSAGCAMV
jgi:hypothetical protein